MIRRLATNFRRLLLAGMKKMKMFTLGISGLLRGVLEPIVYFEINSI